VEAFSVVAARPALVLVAVTQDVWPGRVKTAVLVNVVIVALTVMVVVPAARASRPLRKKRAAGVGAHVIVVFLVVVCVEVYEKVLVCPLAVVVFNTRFPEREIVLVVLEPFWVLVTYEVWSWPWFWVIVTAFGVTVDKTLIVVVALTVTCFGTYVDVE